jgi:hypothetical protein
MDTDHPDYLLRKYKDFLPSKEELAARSMFGATAEEREVAQDLMGSAPSDGEHPFLTLLRLFPEGSEAARLADESPVGKIVKEIIDAQPDEGIENWEFPESPPAVSEIPIAEKTAEPVIVPAAEPEGVSMNLLRGEKNYNRPVITLERPLPPTTIDLGEISPLVW